MKPTLDDDLPYRPDAPLPPLGRSLIALAVMLLLLVLALSASAAAVGVSG